MGRTIVEGYSKLEVAKKVTALALDRGWEPISKIVRQEPFIHNGVDKFICVMEKKGEDINGLNFKIQGR